MTGVIIEKRRAAKVSQQANSETSWDTTYFVAGVGSEGEAAALVRDTTPLSITMMSQLIIRQQVTGKDVGNGLYQVDVSYGPPGKRDDQEKTTGQIYKFSWDTTGATHRVTVAKRIADPETPTATLSQVWKGQRSDTDPAPDLQGAIGWDGKQVNGTEVLVPKLSFELTVYYPPSAITLEFVDALSDATGSMNKAEWHGYEAGELRFDGSTGSGEASVLSGLATAPVPVVLRFSRSKNLTDVKVGSIIVPEKKGWDYLDVKFDKIADEGKVYPVPNYAYVYRVLEEVDLLELLGF